MNNVFIRINQTNQQQIYEETTKILNKIPNLTFVLCINGIYVYDYSSYSIMSKILERFKIMKHEIIFLESRPFVEKNEINNTFVLSNNYYAYTIKNRSYDIIKTFKNGISKIGSVLEHGFKKNYNSIYLYHNMENKQVELILPFEIKTINEDLSDKVRTYLFKELYKFVNRTNFIRAVY